jgi:hypothetical protein
MGGGTGPGIGESTADQLVALRSFFPGAMTAINSMLEPTAQAQANADAAVSDKNAKTQYDTYSKWGPLMNRIGREIMNEDTKGAMEGELALAKGAGRDMATEARSLQELVDPEYFAIRKQIPGRLTEALDALGKPGTLSDTEREEIRRGQAASGFTNPNSGTDAVQAGMEFGQAGRNRNLQLQDAISKAANTLNPLAMSGVEVATRRPLTSNVGENRAPNATQNSGQAANQFGQNMWNGMSDFQMQNANLRATSLDRKLKNMNDTISSVGSVIGSF